ncbi:hypothetical protein GL50803_0024985 [Giardia duodenalis]|uniref:Uncharacterized protein n=1 Tax=Giardia intestinalis (strain ATCC 50803 / WB clone C6) TaxID=184922 RepID=D3KG11_GIAIC|nr:hypothetical protein GL50803_0024985 [Giardia intestinalis]KAE8303022.1 hypothetical protein GL50803_0024985 [Giardia intestinalis]
MDPGVIATQALRTTSNRTGKLRKISYVNSPIGSDKIDAPKKGQPILCNEMRDHISILPSKTNAGRAFVRGMEYLLPNVPDGANIRPQRVLLSIADGPKSSWDRDRSIHLPQAATLCNIGDEYVKPEVRTRVPRPVSVRVLSRYTLGAEKQSAAQQKSGCSLISSFLAQRSADGRGTSRLERRTSYERARSHGGSLFPGSATFHLTDGGTLDSQSSQVCDDSIDLTIYRDPCSIAREVACTKNTQVVTHTDAETAGELQRLHDSCARTSVSSSNPSSTTEMQREYRRPPIISFCAPGARSVAGQKKETHAGPIQSIPTVEPMIVELSHSPPPTFTKPAISTVTPVGPSVVSTKEGSSGLQMSALASNSLGKTSASIQKHTTSSKPPRGQQDPAILPASCPEGSGHVYITRSNTSSTLAESSVHSYDQEHALPDHSSDTSDIAPESLLPGASIRPNQLRARTAAGPASLEVMQLQYRELDNLEASFSRYAASFSCIQNTPEGELNPNSLTAPGVALPSMHPNDPSPSFFATSTAPHSFKARAYSAQSAAAAPRRRFNIINDSAIPEQHIVRPSSRKQVTKAQNVVLGPNQQRGESASRNRWKASLH